MKLKKPITEGKSTLDRKKPELDNKTKIENSIYSVVICPALSILRLFSMFLMSFCELG